MKFTETILGSTYMIFCLKIFRPKREFLGKRIAIIGAADSAFAEKKGSYIDDFDIVIRINKAPHSWNAEKSAFIGSKFTYLFHSFYENNFSGGGPIDRNLYKKLDIKKVVNPNFSRKGLRTHLNFYKRHRAPITTYILPKKNYGKLSRELEGFIPTVGFSALSAVLGEKCKEIYITGFTFFKTPYAKGYRAELADFEANKKHITAQGLHDPEMEFELFKKEVDRSPCSNIHFDNELSKLLNLEPTA
ncbi:MAG TPA: hypothetical protein VFI78_03880 [Salinimicrobium sp.]|nr:hypothetical protein [Salinimicrobium sp.]